MAVRSVCKPPTDPGPRIEHALEIKLGTVFADSDGRPHVFIGTRKNTVGLVYCFIPAMGVYRGEPMIYECSLMSGLRRKFPHGEALCTPLHQIEAPGEPAGADDSLDQQRRQGARER